MSAQRLSPRSLRRIARSTGLDVVRGWSHGGTWLVFVTRDHLHGTWHRRTGEHHIQGPGDEVMHYSSCPKDGKPVEPWDDDERWPAQQTTPSKEKTP